MFYVIPVTEREKPRYDAYLEGILLYNNGELAINLFMSGISVFDKAKRSYKIRIDPEFSEVGKIRDRVVTLVHNSPIIIVSEKFKNLLQSKFNDQAEFFPVEIDQANNKPLIGYEICNIIKKYDCTDYANSDLLFEYPDDKEGISGIFTINSLVIDQKKIPVGAHIFLLDNIKKPILVISGELKREMDEQGINGFQFTLPQNFMI